MDAPYLPLKGTRLSEEMALQRFAVDACDDPVMARVSPLVEAVREGYRLWAIAKQSPGTLAMGPALSGVWSFAGMMVIEDPMGARVDIIGRGLSMRLLLPMFERPAELRMRQGSASDLALARTLVEGAYEHLWRDMGVSEALYKLTDAVSRGASGRGVESLGRRGEGQRLSFAGVTYISRPEGAALLSSSFMAGLPASGARGSSAVKFLVGGPADVLVSLDAVEAQLPAPSLARAARPMARMLPRSSAPFLRLVG